MYISPGDVNMTPNQIRELQDALNAFAGDTAWHHKVIVLPPGSRVDPQKPVDVADQFDEIVMTQVCMAFDVNPMELGILPKVATTAVAVSSEADGAAASASIHERHLDQADAEVPRRHLRLASSMTSCTRTT